MRFLSETYRLELEEQRVTLGLHHSAEPGQHADDLDMAIRNFDGMTAVKPEQAERNLDALAAMMGRRR